MAIDSVLMSATEDEVDELVTARRARGMSQKDLSEATGVSGRTITRIESRERARTGKPADRYTLRQLQKYLQVGPYKPSPPDAQRAAQPEPPPAAPVRGRLLDEASVPELAAALIARHEADLRAALGNGAALHVLDETPPDVVTRARRGDIPSGKEPPNEGTSPE